ncbi:pantetheine-phosphate adenylyltransferase [Arthrobacter agilis]|uniref:pantetheine-phosphate adenylyltransferase n=1 Tax=Arthrobacter agilis TaxID=37921 RepID=UPI000B360445|nr:pantetheine-phosphate adenylyltransferase [Arthrobacter agilis]OUM44836.1 pantetheine-phosphate adenylyltransferase [Arthrobacter agilis]PPB47160.1 pantetheine-phosphate adenylyltransferase [Arthrobacter agilis]TPV22574.1 pantetheine-phosphate adenylyltransferase [Arthrobacter agilis]VDR32399.1 Phosphopantetheine adenylyltransferase [Arthrobacter agilis]
MSRAVCPGSFDPLHNGHIEIIGRAARLFDEVIVAVSTNPAKTYRFGTDERLDLCRQGLAHLPGVRVLPMDGGLVAGFCRDHGASALVKGLRSSLDFDYELPMSTMNRHLADVETVFLPTGSEYAHVSSTLLKEVASLGGDIGPFVPAIVLQRLAENG